MKFFHHICRGATQSTLLLSQNQEQTLKIQFWMISSIVYSTVSHKADLAYLSLSIIKDACLSSNPFLPIHSQQELAFPFFLSVVHFLRTELLLMDFTHLQNTLPWDCLFADYNTVVFKANHHHKYSNLILVIILSH